MSARFAEKDEEENLILSGYTCVESEKGKIYYKKEHITFTDEVLFKLVNLYWTQHIMISGVRSK